MGRWGCRGGPRQLLRWLDGYADEFRHSFTADARDLVCVVHSYILGDWKKAGT